MVLEMKQSTVNKLKTTLIREGITQASLARKINMSVGTINKICNNGLSGSPTTQNKIVKGINELVKTTYVAANIFAE